MKKPDFEITTLNPSPTVYSEPEEIKLNDALDFNLRVSTNAVKQYIRRLRERAGDDWHKVKPELLATIEDIGND